MNTTFKLVMAFSVGVACTFLTMAWGVLPTYANPKHGSAFKENNNIIAGLKKSTNRGVRQIKEVKVLDRQRKVLEIQLLEVKFKLSKKKRDIFRQQLIRKDLVKKFSQALNTAIDAAGKALKEHCKRKYKLKASFRRLCESKGSHELLRKKKKLRQLVHQIMQTSLDPFKK